MTRLPSATTASTGPRGHEVDQRLVERLADVLGVVLGKQARIGRAQLHSDQPVALALYPGQDLTRQIARDAVGLDQESGCVQSRAQSRRQPNRTPACLRSGDQHPPAGGRADQLMPGLQQIKPIAMKITTTMAMAGTSAMVNARTTCKAEPRPMPKAVGAGNRSRPCTPRPRPARWSFGPEIPPLVWAIVLGMSSTTKGSRQRMAAIPPRVARLARCCRSRSCSSVGCCHSAAGSTGSSAFTDRRRAALAPRLRVTTEPGHQHARPGEQSLVVVLGELDRRGQGVVQPRFDSHPVRAEDLDRDRPASHPREARRDEF